MKNKITMPGVLAIIALIMTAASCAAPKSYATFADWDVSMNSAVERNEFVQGYTASNYFDKWSGRGSITYAELAQGVFKSLDYNGDGKLNNAEFDSQIKLFYFGLFRDRFEGWDDDSDNSVRRAEFDKHIMASNFALTWDTNNDKLISEREMAGGMFYVSDANSDGKVTGTELDDWRKRRESW